MRKTFTKELHKLMKKNRKIFFLVGDLGSGIFNDIKNDYPERFINCGSAEQTMIGMAVGLANGGKIPLVYSITPFLIFRPYEFLTVLVCHDKANIKLIGSGRAADYIDHNFTHLSPGDKKVMRSLPNIKSYYPESSREIPNLLKKIIKIKGPCYVNLIR